MNAKVLTMFILGTLVASLPMEIEAASPILTVLAQKKKHKKPTLPAPAPKPINKTKKG